MIAHECIKVRTEKRTYSTGNHFKIQFPLQYKIAKSRLVPLWIALTNTQFYIHELKITFIITCESEFFALVTLYRIALHADRKNHTVLRSVLPRLFFCNAIVTLVTNCNEFETSLSEVLA